MECLFLVFLLMFVATPTFCARVTPNAGSSTFNVVSYGAKGDGNTDDSQAFEKAWQDVCGATQITPTFLVPYGKSFMLQPVSFEGPCKSNTINIQIQGTIVAPNVSAWNWPSNNDRDAWVRFRDINGLVINGGGIFDGQGDTWWTHYSNRPSALNFVNCKYLALSRLYLINSPRSHLSISSCSDSTISDIYIIAPEESPNTDGIDIAGSSNIVIENSVIETGDDCIAINGGSTFMNITGITCGPGHGISVGSLGKNGAYDTVEEIHVKNCTFIGTMNGARIKTWVGGSGYARKITFEDITLIGARNPVIINQQYVGFQYDADNTTYTAVQVSDVTYRNVKGTSSSENAITLRCDNHDGCTNVVLNDIAITSANGGETQALCNNVRGISSSCNPSVSCLSS